jgi:type II restriction enzyme
MNTKIYNKSVLDKYHSKSQIARILTENWFEREMYCPNCLHQELLKNPNNTKVTDFVCDSCDNTFQLKAQSKPFYSKVVDGAFYPMITSVQQNTTPNFSFMQYSCENWKIQNLFFVPKFFFTASIIERRKALSSSARRKGWIGCNVILSKIPELGKIKVIEHEIPLPEKVVQKNWKKLSFMNTEHAGKRAWLSDILYCIEQLNKNEFSLDEIYSYDVYLSKLHPNNYHIKPKIRQQLQILRDKGILEFTSRGIYTTKK